MTEERTPGMMSEGSGGLSSHPNSPFSESYHESEPSSLASGKRRRLDDTTKQHYRTNFFSIPETHAYDLFCDFEYQNLNPIAKPELHTVWNQSSTARVSRSVPASVLKTMKMIADNQIDESHRTGGGLNRNNTAYKVDIFGSVVPNMTATCPGFAKRRTTGVSLDTMPLSRLHPLGANRRFTDEQMKLKKTEKEQEVEALFLRRPILVQNDLYSKGDQIVVGAEAAEKNLPRKPIAESTPEEILARIEATFIKAQNLNPKHPTINNDKRKPGEPLKKEPKLVSRRFIEPDANHWSTTFTQVQFDEPTNIKENDQNPAVFWGEDGNGGRTVFGLLTPDADKEREHKLERPYIWANRGEYEANRHLENYALFHMPTGPTTAKDKPIRFSAIGNKIMVKKMLAQLQSGSRGLSDVGGLTKKRIEWRKPTERENAIDSRKLLEVMEPRKARKKE